MPQPGSEVGTHLYRCDECLSYWVTSTAPEKEDGLITCDAHPTVAHMQYVGNLNNILKEDHMERKQVILGQKQEIKAEETTDGLFNGKRLIKFELLMAVDMTDEELDTFSDEITVEVAEHLIKDERVDKCERTILVDHVDIRRMSPVDGYNMHELFKKAVEEGATA